ASPPAPAPKSAPAGPPTHPSSNQGGSMRTRRVVIFTAAAFVASVVGQVTQAGVATAAGCTNWTSQTQPPASIRVGMTHTQSGGPVYAVAKVAFKTYVKDVLPNEWVTSWERESLRSGAMAAKAYSWYYAMHSGHGGVYNGSCYDVLDNQSSQVYEPGSHLAVTDAAVDDTWTTR